MSTVLLFIDDWAEQRTTAVAKIRELYGISLGDILARARSGKPILDRELYDRLDPDFADRLLTLLRQLESLGVRYRAPQLLDGQRFDPAMTYYQLTADRLQTMNAARAASLQRHRLEKEDEPS